MKKTVSLLCLMMALRAGCAQEIKMPQAPRQSAYTEFSLQDKGYWWSTEFSGGSSLAFHEKNLGTLSVSFVNGYRFNDFLRIGVGVGVQYHVANNNDVRNTRIKWTMPIYINARGNFMSQEVREIVPFWSVDVGGVVRDGFLLTPSVGCRIGERRSAFLLSVGYSLRTIDARKGCAKTRNYALLKLGYEF